MLQIDVMHNCATLPCGDRVVWRRKWVALVLSQLLLEGQAQRPLHLEKLQQSLASLGQDKPLAPTSLLRIFDDVSCFFERLSGQPLYISYPPRKATLGPWQLQWRAPYPFEVKAWQRVGVQAETYPQLLKQTPCCTAQLCSVLLCFLCSDAFTVHGQYQDALEALAPIHGMPLTDDAKLLVAMRKSQCLSRMGDFEQARQCLLQAQRYPFVTDAAAQAHVSLLLDRLDYDTDPQPASERLWHTSMSPPLLLGADSRFVHEWHNLRALLCRRRLLSQADPDMALHAQALKHLQAALYLALYQRDWTRLQAYAANLAFHLQSVLPLGLSDFYQVFAWHELILIYADKLDAGADSAWEYIFFAEFWLDHQDALNQLPPQSGGKGGVPVIGNLHPKDEAFYQAAVGRVKACGDPRQLALCWLCYLRFARGQLSAPQQHDIRQELRQLLKTHEALRDVLVAEGYGKHLNDV